MPRTLLSLPVEVIQIICGFLSAKDGLILRLICRVLNAKVKYYTENYSFNNISTDLSKENLESLESFLKPYEQVGSHVETLFIKDPYSKDDYGWVTDLGRGFPWPRYCDVYNCASHHLAPAVPIVDHMRYLHWEWNTSCHVHRSGTLLPGLLRLQQLVSKHLPACRSLHIQAYQDVYTLDCQRRFQYSALGHTVSLLTWLVEETIPNIETLWLGRPTEPHWRARYGHRLHGCRLSKLPLKPNFQSESPSQTRCPWALLRDLAVWLLDYPMADTTRWIEETIKNATNLKRISFCFHPRGELSFSHIIEALHPPLPAIEELECGNFRANDDECMKFMLHFQESLKELNMHHGKLMTQFCRCMNRNWSLIFETLSKFPFLQKLSISHLFHHSMIRIRRPDGSNLWNDHTELVVFPKLAQDPVIPGTSGQRFELIYDKFGASGDKGNVVGVEYEGPNMDKAIIALAESIELYNLGPDRQGFWLEI